MEILIADKRTVREIQKEFNEEFPFLKIEFFDTPHRRKQSSPKSKMYAGELRLALCRKVHNEGVIAIEATDSVTKFEELLWEKFGLSAQIFRKSGRLWIETSLTDSWTLERQNMEGQELSRTHKNPYEEADENDLTDRDKWA
jgi:hypothetical protein